MPKFFYVARDTSGRKITDSEEVASTDELVARLQARNLIVVNVLPESVEAAESLRAKIPTDTIKKFRRYRITNHDLVLFCRQLATLLAAGVTILRSLDIISQQVPSRKFYNILKDLMRNMESGLSFHEAMSKHPKVFSDLWVNLSESGEASGNLAIVLGRLADFMERNATFKRKVISSLIYPVLLLLAGLGALLFLTIKIIPTFINLFKDFNVTLPLLTRIIFAMSTFIRKYILLIFAIIIAGFFIFAKFLQTKEGRRRFEQFQFNLPLFGDFFHALVVERFSSGMSTLIESGIPLLYSLEISEHSVGSIIVADIVRQIKEEVREGKPLSRTLEKSGFFEPMVVQMVTVGEEIGELPQMLKRINTFYREYVETFLERLGSLFEPIMLIFMGFVIGLIVIGMFLPIFQIATLGGSGR
jgi:type IV pilus assembly protein PilC